MANKEQIKKEYETGKYTFKDLAEKYNISLGTIKSWAKRDKDNKQPWSKVATKTQKVATKTQKVATRRKVTEDKKEEILTLAAIGKPKAEIARETGISRPTVIDVLKKSPDELNAYRQQKKLEFIQRAWDTVNKALEFGNQKIILATVTAENFDSKIEELIQAMKDNKADPKIISETVKAFSAVMNVPLRDVAIYIGTIYDKIALATGSSTANVNLHTLPTAEEAMKSLSLEELRNLARLDEDL